MQRDFASHRAGDVTESWPGTLTLPFTPPTQPSGMTDPRSFKELRDSLYRSLVAHSCVPKEEHDDGAVTDQLEKRFFPEGTATNVLTPSKLERLFALVIATGHSPLQVFHPRDLAQRLNHRRLHVYLAILITSKCDMESLLSFTENLVASRAWTDVERELAQLPVQHRGNLRRVLGDDVTADIFFQKQYDFFAPVIVKYTEVKGQFHRLPYVSQKLIGQGSFGKIYKVVISPHHFKDQHDMVNDKEKIFARKDFELNAEDRAYERERDVLREIVRSAKQHNNIMKSLGSLENGTIYSIFMPLADCDLKQYMEKHPAPPGSPAEKARIVQCSVGLAGAIVYLHEELESPAYEKLSCFHMDLKPQNILVVIDPTSGEMSWRLSDFNMSRVKMKRVRRLADEHSGLQRSFTFNDNVYEINKIFKRRAPDVNDASASNFTINRRGYGTYLAPEACIEGYPLQAESDTWSLGCVISLIFSYLHGGQAAVTNFAELRYAKGFDSFFTFSGGNDSHKLKNAYVNEAVKRWHSQLRMETKRRDADEGIIFERMIKFLGNEVLVIDPKQREKTTARDIRERLIEAYNAFKTMALMVPVSPGPKKSRFRLSGMLSRKRGPESDLPSEDWKIHLSSTVKACAFGPNAHPLVCITNSNLTVHSLEHVLLSADPDGFDDNLMTYGQASPQDVKRLWLPNVGVSTQYILAATDHHSFDCYFYRIPEPGNHNSKLELAFRWQLPAPQIAVLALSPDAQYAAFVLSNPAKLQTSCLYIVRLDWLQAARNDNRVFSIVSSSSDSSSSPSSPLGKAISLPCPAADICELAFSGVNGLYAVAKPRQINSTADNVMHVYAWSLHNGRRTALPQSPIKHDGQDDIFRSLFTWFCPYNQSMAFALVSQEKKVITRAWDLKKFTQSNARGFRLLQVLLDPEDQDVLAFGTKEANNDLHLLTFPTADARDELKIKIEKKLKGMTHQSRFIAAVNTTSTGTLPQRNLLLAIMEGMTIRIVRVGLTPP